jgi:hypothetical protein
MTMLSINDFGRVKDPCPDCFGDRCTMNCSGRENIPDEPRFGIAYPIQTAHAAGTFDGRGVLLFSPHTGWRRGRFNHDKYSQKQRPFWDYDHCRISESRYHQPTHWMPLPPDPVAEEKDGPSSAAGE